jgi:hypothetical protein
VAIPLFEVYENAQRYGVVLSSLPHMLSRCGPAWGCLQAQTKRAQLPQANLLLARSHPCHPSGSPRHDARLVIVCVCCRVPRRFRLNLIGTAPAAPAGGPGQAQAAQQAQQHGEQAELDAQYNL